MSLLQTVIRRLDRGICDKQPIWVRTAERGFVEVLADTTTPVVTLRLLGSGPRRSKRWLEVSFSPSKAEIVIEKLSGALGTIAEAAPESEKQDAIRVCEVEEREDG